MSKAFQYLLLAFAFLYVASLGSYGIENADTYFHLRAGQEIVSGAWAPWNMGHFSSADSADWVSTQWVPQAGMALVVNAWGLTGLVWSAVATYVFIFACLYRILRSYVNTGWASVALMFFAYSAGPFLSVRPQVWSFLFMALLVHLWFQASKRVRVPYWTVLIFFAWPHFHGIWIAGVVTTVLLAIGFVAQHGRRWVKPVAGVVALSTLATFASPLGLKLWAQTFEVVRYGTGLGAGTEWAAPSYTGAQTFPVAALLALTLYGTWRWSRDYVAHAAALAGLGWALWAERSVPLAILCLLLTAAYVASSHETSRGVVRTDWTHKHYAPLGLAMAASLAFFSLIAPSSPTQYAPVSDEMAAAAAKLDPGTKVLTDFSVGSYLLYAAPDLAVPVHGYTDAFSEEEKQTLITLFEMQPGWDDVAEAERIEYALVPLQSHLAYGVEQEGWDLVYDDSVLGLYRAPSVTTP